MARFGRSQPHGPIFLRAPLLAAVAAVATVSPIHIIEASRLPPLVRRTTVTYLRPPVSSLVPDRITPQIHVLLQPRRRPVPPVHVVAIRNPQPGFLSALAPPNHVISLATERFRMERRAAIIFLRPPVSSLVPDRIPQQIHVLAQPRRGPIPPVHVIALRSPQSAPLSAKAPPSHVVSLATERFRLERRTAIIFLRPNVGSVVPDRLPPRIHVLLQQRPRPVIRRLGFVLVRPFRAPPVYTLLVLDLSDASGPAFDFTDASTPVWNLADRSCPVEAVTDTSIPASELDDASIPGEDLSDESLP